MLVYVVRAAINDWGNLYMSETLGVDLVTANSAVTMFELGGFIGALVAGWGSDKLFNGNRGPMNLIFAAGILLSVGGLWLMPFASYVMQAACFFTTGFFVFGPQMLIGMAAAECSHKEAAGAATGLSGCLPISGVAVRLAAGAGHGNLALERFSWSSLLPPAFPRCCCCHFKRSGTQNRQRSVTCLSFTPSEAKLRNFPGCAGHCLRPVAARLFTMPAIRRYKISPECPMLAFLNQVRKPTWICRSMCGVKCGSNRSCSPIWWSLLAT